MTELQTDELVVDEWGPGREMLRSALRRAGHTAEGADVPAEALRAMKALRPQVLLLDHALCSRDDWELIRRARAVSELAIIVVVDSDHEAKRLQALSRGADDYEVKPVDCPSLVAAVGAYLRMLRRMAEPGGDDVDDDGLVEVQVGRRHVEVAGRQVALTPLEFRLLTALIRHRDRVVSREELHELADQAGGAAPRPGTVQGKEGNWLGRRTRPSQPGFGGRRGPWREYGRRLGKLGQGEDRLRLMNSFSECG